MKDPVHAASDPIRLAERIRCDCCTTCRWADGGGCVAGGPYGGYRESAPLPPVKGTLSCAVCGGSTPATTHVFPQRPAPHNRPYLAALYHRDPFSGQPLENYCGAACATKART